ncbi:MAG: response regulator [Pseudomonadota bacterium]
MTGQVLLIEDDDALRTSLAQSIELAGLTALAMSSYVQAKRSIRANFPGVILSDIRMPNQDGFDVLRAAQTADPDLPVILLTGHSDVPTAMRAIKEGAWDYLEKPCSPDRLMEALGRALTHRRLALRSRKIERALQRRDPAAVHFPGVGPASEGLRTALRTVAQSSSHVHLWGARGTGRRQAGFVINQLAEDPRTLVRLDLSDTAPEALDLPDGPVDLVCRDAGEAPIAAIESLALRVAKHPQLRLITLAVASMADLGWRDIFGLEATAHAIVEIRLPSLEDRREDLPEIFETLLRQAARNLDMNMPEIPDTLFAELITRSWPGNLPELRNFATSFALGSTAHRDEAAGQTLATQVETFERLVISETLRRMNGNASKAAKALGLPRNTFYDRLTKYGLSPKEFRS